MSRHSRSSSAPLPTRGIGVNDFGSGHPFGGQGSSAAEIPPMYRPAASAGGPDRVSDPIPFRRPGSDQDPRAEMQKALRGEIQEELHAADPVVPGADATALVAEPKLGPTGRPWPDLPEPRPIGIHGNARIISMCNQKGGVGKTTSTINLGAALAEHGRRVLLVDLDPQGALSAGLGVPHYELDQTVHNLLVEPRVSIDEVIIKTRVSGMDLVPSNIDLSAAEIHLVNEVRRWRTRPRALHPGLDRY